MADSEPGTMSQPECHVELAVAQEANSKAFALQPCHGVEVCFKDLSVEVKDAKDKQPLKLLDGVSGSLMAGQMTALMGPSGSGKTTLLDVLSGRKSTGLNSGTILYGGRVATKAYLRAATGYVEQQTTLIPAFTVYEMLLYTAELKRSWREPRTSKVAVVEALMQDLQLQSCAHVLIGDSLTKGISGGQAKRVSIGVAMVCVPPVLYLDEPTSGLDSQSAYEIMEVVHKAALDGTTVAVAIHSPGPEVFAMFGSVIALARGHIFYSGGTGDYHMNALRLSAQPWLEGVPDNIAFADLLLKIAAVATARGDVQRLCAAPPPEIVSRPDPPPTSSSTRQGQQGMRTMNPPWYLLWLMLRYRAFRNWTTPLWMLTRFVDKLIMALIMVTLFYGQGTGLTPTYLVNLTAGLFMCAVIPTFAAYTYAPGLLHDRALYYREVADGLYGPFVYLAYRVVEEVTALVPISLIFTPIVFYVIKYQGSFVLFWLVYIATLTTSVEFGFFTSTLSKTQDLAYMLVTLYVLACFFSAGQIATLSTLPIYWTWISRINYVRYAWSALLLNQFETADPAFTADGQTVLQFYSTSGNMWRQLGFVAVFAAVFHVLEEDE